MKRDFDQWIESFRSNIADYKYYVDFDKIYKNVENINIELNILNSLIGVKDFDGKFKKLCTEYPKILECIPILIAVRNNEIEIQEKDKSITYNFKYHKNVVLDQYLIDDYLTFMIETGLKELIQNRIINNLVDYVLGVEVGLDSNGRKNRGGHLMENLLEKYIQELGVEYYKEMYTKEIENRWNIDLSLLTNAGDVAKRFDFVVKTNNQIYAFETNFYKSGGSKLNETARSFKNIAEEIDKIQGITFIWVTDGKGWISARHNLKETFDVLDTLYNINDLENGILNVVVK